MPRPRVRAITPLLVVSDLARSVEFYSKPLGFRDPQTHGDPPCFAMLQRDGFDLMLSKAEDATHVRPHGAYGVWDLYIHVADIAAEIEALAAASVAIDRGPTDMFYGMREVEVLDPDGHRICLAEDTTVAPEADVEAWEGTLDVGGARLRLVLKLRASDQGLSATLDSLDQGALDLPVDRITREERELRFEMRALAAEYAGTFSSDGRELTGMWSQRGTSWPLVFRRARQD